MCEKCAHMHQFAYNSINLGEFILLGSSYVITHKLIAAITNTHKHLMGNNSYSQLIKSDTRALTLQIKLDINLCLITS